MTSYYGPWPIPQRLPMHNWPHKVRNPVKVEFRGPFVTVCEDGWGPVAYFEVNNLTVEQALDSAHLGCTFRSPKGFVVLDQKSKLPITERDLDLPNEESLRVYHDSFVDAHLAVGWRLQLRKIKRSINNPMCVELIYHVESSNGQPRPMEVTLHLIHDTGPFPVLRDEQEKIRSRYEPADMEPRYSAEDQANIDAWRKANPPRY